MTLSINAETWPDYFTPYFYISDFVLLSINNAIIKTVIIKKYKYIYYFEVQLTIRVYICLSAFSDRLRVLVEKNHSLEHQSNSNLFQLLVVFHLCIGNEQCFLLRIAVNNKYFILIFL